MSAFGTSVCRKCWFIESSFRFSPFLDVNGCILAEVNEQKKKRMKADSDLSRLSPAASMRSQLEQAASLKGEQVRLLIL